jgi:hypothetical protein
MCNSQLIDLTASDPGPAQGELSDRQLADGQGTHRECAQRERSYHRRTDGNGSFASYGWCSGRGGYWHLAWFRCLTFSIIAHRALLPVEVNSIDQIGMSVRRGGPGRRGGLGPCFMWCKAPHRLAGEKVDAREYSKFPQTERH